jgi:Phage integrase family
MPENMRNPVGWPSKQGELPMNVSLHPVGPRNENRPVGLGRPTNASLRTREYLTPAEIEKLIKAAKDGRYGQRDACLILTSYRHGLRTKEACELEWSQVEFSRNAALHVRRVKNGKPSVHPIRGDELRWLSELRKEYPDTGYVFTTQRGTPFGPDAINRLIKNIGKRAKLPQPTHFHMLRHSCGYKLANDGIDTRAIQDWLGHVSITHTTRYTQLSAARFKDFWRKPDGLENEPAWAHIRAMGKGWKFVGEFKQGRKACLAIECIVMLPDLEDAKAIASRKLVGADEITAKELSRAEMKALNLKEGEVLLGTPTS